MSNINGLTKTLFAVSRFYNGLLSYYSGATLLIEPHIMLKYVAHYDVPDNFGWSWYDVAPNNSDQVSVKKYGYWEN